MEKGMMRAEAAIHAAAAVDHAAVATRAINIVMSRQFWCCILQAHALAELAKRAIALQHGVDAQPAQG